MLGNSHKLEGVCVFHLCDVALAGASAKSNGNPKHK